jgi:predicted phage tail component-like protein
MLPPLSFPSTDIIHIYTHHVKRFSKIIRKAVRLLKPGEINFSFNGLHCYRDFRCWAIWTQKPMGGKVTRNTHKVSGRSGTVLLSGTPVYDEMQWDCSLGFREPPASEARAQERWRAICAWLRAGRCELTQDCEPERYWLAEVDDEIGLSYEDWDEGELTVRFTVQPYSYARNRSTALKTFTAPGTLPLTVPSCEPVPIGITAENTGTRTVTGLTVLLGDAQVRMAGLALLPGDTLTLTMDDPIGATLSHQGTDTGALDKATAFDPLLGCGAELRVLAYGRGVAA